MLSLCLWFGNVQEDDSYTFLEEELRRIGNLRTFVVSDIFVHAWIAQFRPFPLQASKEKHCAFANYDRREDGEHAFSAIQTAKFRNTGIKVVCTSDSLSVKLRLSESKSPCCCTRALLFHSCCPSSFTHQSTVARSETTTSMHLPLIIALEYDARMTTS